MCHSKSCFFVVTCMCPCNSPDCVTLFSLITIKWFQRLDLFMLFFSWTFGWSEDFVVGHTSVFNVSGSRNAHVWMHGCVCKASSAPAPLTSDEIIMRTSVASERGMWERRWCSERNRNELKPKCWVGHNGSLISPYFCIQKYFITKSALLRNASGFLLIPLFAF